MKKITLAFLLTAVSLCAQSQTKSFYDLKANTLSGKELDFSTLKGKRVLLVNTASKCGLTPQYKALQELHEKYSKKDFVIIGFPSNNFGQQEPGTHEEIASFCQVNYGVKFQMMEKVEVKGENICPVYQWLTQKKQNGVQDSEVTWNFQKYLINEKGELVAVINPKELPNSEQIIEFITTGAIKNKK
ncbi:MAG: glutathione peroxidase [Bacteroidales bacterium]